MKYSGKFILISGTAGSGKGTMLSMLRDKYTNFVFLKSITTRAPRGSEVVGEHYDFISEDEFKKKIEADEFLEYAYVHKSAFYGTLKEPIFSALKNGKTVLKEVDYQGFLQIKEKILAQNLISIFIMPPSIESIKKRIRQRAKISDEELNKRIGSIEKEMKNAIKYDIQFNPIDGDIDKSFELFEKLIL